MRSMVEGAQHRSSPLHPASRGPPPPLRRGGFSFRTNTLNLPPLDGEGGAAATGGVVPQPPPMQI